MTNCILQKINKKIKISDLHKNQFTFFFITPNDAWQTLTRPTSIDMEHLEFRQQLHRLLLRLDACDILRSNVRGSLSQLKSLDHRGNPR